MCGIAGYIAAGADDPDPSLVARMCDRIRHRGPDDCGYFHDGPVALGHRRLSIIDVSGGRQPLGNEDGSLQIVFNGEIYNYLELRDDLLKKGHRFATHSDTETIVHLYEEVGERLPEFLNGMFAFAIWDARRRELFLARDRFGKKPLYYSTEAPGFRFCFASELKALRVLPGFDAAINSRAMADYLAFGYVADPDTIYRRVLKLTPGSSLLVAQSRDRVRKYWGPQFEVDERAGFADSVEKIRALAADSVQRRMISDVPLGGFLSGGVDSSSVVAFMARDAGRQVKSFSIGFSSKDYDEVHYARMVARRYRTEHHEEIVTPSVHETLCTLVEHYDEPFADNSAIPTLYLARMTRKYVTVALSGDGADELFGGYRRYRFSVAEERARNLMPGWLRRSAIRKAGEYYPKFDYLPRILRAKTTLLGLAQDLGEAYAAAMSGFRFGLLNEVLAPEVRGELDGYSPVENFASRFAKYRHLPPLGQLQAVDLETYLPGDILVKVDRASMAYSLEARCPWLDYRLGELALRLPPAFKLHRGVGKYVFKEMVKPLIPREIVTRPKMGFVAPAGEWFRSSLKKTFEALVFRADLARYVSLEAVRRIWRMHQAGRRDFGRELWGLLMLACWDDRHAGPRPGGALEEALS